MAKSLSLPASALPVDVTVNKIYTHSPTHPSRYVCSEDAVNDGCEPDVVLGPQTLYLTVKGKKSLELFILSMNLNNSFYEFST